MRDAFATILEESGILSNLLLTFFAPSKELFFDLKNNNFENYKRLQVINVLDEIVYYPILGEHINFYTLKQILLEMKNTLKLQKKHR